MNQFKVVSQLFLQDGELKCKKPNSRSAQKAHFKQGDLDGACGAYSIVMALTILGVFDADVMNSNDDLDGRTSKGKLIRALNEEGLYRDGLDSNDIIRILDNYKKLVTTVYADKEGNLISFVKDTVDQDLPSIIRLGWDKYNGHWVVAVGYALDANGEISDILVLDPGTESPKYSLWNGMLNLQKVPRKKYPYCYNGGNCTLSNKSAQLGHQLSLGF